MLRSRQSTWRLASVISNSTQCERRWCSSSPLPNCAATARAGTGRAPETVPTRSDFAFGELFRVEIRDRLWELGRNAEFQHLIEIAVVESPCPIDRNKTTTHQAFHRMR